MLHCFCLKLQWKTPERRSCAGFFIVNFARIKCNVWYLWTCIRLTLPVLVADKEKLNLNFYFQTSFQALKAFLKPFEAPQRSVKIKI